jgi:undecaprenyl phosphate-alpha-L-ara4N flippase subunit ArnE
MQKPPQNILPILLLLANASCITAAELLLKTGALQTTPTSILGISALGSPYTAAGIFFYIAGFGAWLYVLKSVPLALAFNFTTIQQPAVFLASWYFLGDPLPPKRILGILILMLGVTLLVPAIITAEQKTDT